MKKFVYNRDIYFILLIAFALTMVFLPVFCYAVIPSFYDNAMVYLYLYSAIIASFGIIYLALFPLTLAQVEVSKKGIRKTLFGFEKLKISWKEINYYSRTPLIINRGLAIHYGDGKVFTCSFTLALQDEILKYEKNVIRINQLKMKELYPSLNAIKPFKTIIDRRLSVYNFILITLFTFYLMLTVVLASKVINRLVFESNFNTMALIFIGLLSIFFIFFIFYKKIVGKIIYAILTSANYFIFALIFSINSYNTVSTTISYNNYGLFDNNVSEEALNILPEKDNFNFKEVSKYSYSYIKTNLNKYKYIIYLEVTLDENKYLEIINNLDTSKAIASSYATNYSEIIYQNNYQVEKNSFIGETTIANILYNATEHKIIYNYVYTNGPEISYYDLDFLKKFSTTIEEYEK